MLGRFGLVCRVLALLVFVLSAALPVDARSESVSSKNSLRDRQTTLFLNMTKDPQNLDLMFRYAGISARLQDYEAAISTLERMLVFNADLPRVRLELGALYFNIGSYALAERYFRAVIADQGIPPEVASRVNRFLTEIEKRQRRHHFAGRLEFGAIYDTNAGLGPENTDVLLFGRRARLVSGLGDEEDVGASVLASLTHRYDFGGPRRDFWQTDARFQARRYDDVDAGDSTALFLKTGPQVSLDDTLYGPKIRPYIAADYVRSDGERLYQGAEIGFDYLEVLSSDWSLFSTVSAGIRNHDDRRRDEDGAIINLRSGLAWRGVRDLTLTAAVDGVFDRAKEDFQSNTEASLRLSASFDYDPGVGFTDRKWQLSGYAAATYRVYDAPDPTVTLAETRKDTDLRIGAQHVFHFTDGFYASVGVSALMRDSTISNFELENFGASAALGYQF